MNEQTADTEWLRDFARKGDQEAFRRLVRRHLDLVFATACRKTGDAGAAEEVSQNVFSALARKAWTFAPDDSVPAWLYRAALLESKNWVRGELRRRRRENAAAELGTTMNTTDEKPAFHALVPLLDDGLQALREPDRVALLLRYYEKQSLREVGLALGVSEDTAQKRVASALERLVQFFRRRGFRTASVAAAGAALQHTTASASAATMVMVSNGAIEAAPPILAGLSAWLGPLITLSKLQTVALCAVVSAGPILWQLNDQHRAHQQLALAAAHLADVTGQLQDLSAQSSRLRAGNLTLENSLADLTGPAELSAQAASRFDTWRTRIRGELTDADYHWPDDSPFVRIPKSALPEIDTHRAVGISQVPNSLQPDPTRMEWTYYRGGWSDRTVFSRPGTVSTVARELLGLTPNERTNIESALQTYISSTDASIAASAYQTNHSTHIEIPPDAPASLVWVVPANNQAPAREKQFESAAHSVLGEDRWPIMAAMLGGIIGSLEPVGSPFGSGKDQKSIEVALWVTQDQKLVQFRSWSGRWQDTYGMSWANGCDLSWLSPTSPMNQSGGTAAFLGVDDLPVPMRQAIIDWAQQQAIQRTAKDSSQ